MDFYNTVGGRRFVDGTVPALVKAIKENTETNKELIRLLKALHPELTKKEDAGRKEDK